MYKMRVAAMQAICTDKENIFRQNKIRVTVSTLKKKKSKFGQNRSSQTLKKETQMDRLSAFINTCHYFITCYSFFVLDC